MSGLQSTQELIPIRTPTPNEQLSEGMLTWPLVLTPVVTTLVQAFREKRNIHPIRYVGVEPFAIVGGSPLLPKDFQLSTVTPLPPSGGSTSGQSGNPPTTGGTTGTAPLPVSATVPVSYAVYTFKPTITRSVVTVTQIRSIVLSLTYYMAHWTFAIWIPSLQRYIEYLPSAQVPQANWVTINAATPIEAAGTATIELIFGMLVDPAVTPNLTAPYGSIAVNNYAVPPHLFVSGLGAGGAASDPALEARVTALENTVNAVNADLTNAVNGTLNCP